ncbi:MAG: metallophosphoesterase family protein [Polyangiaceae bacterium]
MGRTVIVGDVHGCADELSVLLDRVRFDTGDRLVFVGDLVARGPDSLGVLDIAHEKGALLVRGNHEAKLLLAKEEGNLGILNPGHRKVAEELRPRDWKLLEWAPLSLDLPEHNIRIVHAGVDPTVSWEKQDPKDLLHIRVLRENDGEMVLWSERYYGPTHIVFGHHAMAGLQLQPFSTGLDTGCVYGNRLTALVLGERETILAPTDDREMKQLCSVAAKRIYFDPQGSRAA